jgi:dihydroorotate dehydrogenase electron transfer subunit
MPKVKQGKFQILDNRRVAPDFFRMKISAPTITRAAQAGQFVSVRCSEGYRPLLRRPFGFHRIGQCDFEILYKVVGTGTRLLSEKRKGEYLDILGPLGNGFLRNTEYEIRNTILIAGGIGVAPMLALAETLKKYKPTVLLGAKTKKELVCKKDFQKLGCSVKTATDDGSFGFKGYVSELFKKVLRTTNDERRTTVFACGPKPMLKEVAKICRQHKITAFGSLHELIACGIGACLSCVIRLRSCKEHKRICTDGPVFDLAEVAW